MPNERQRQILELAGKLLASLEGSNGTLLQTSSQETSESKLPPPSLSEQEWMDLGYTREEADELDDMY